MFRRKLRITFFLRVGLRGLQRLLALQREFVESNHGLLRLKGSADFLFWKSAARIYFISEI
jgi:hypothetical protein